MNIINTIVRSAASGFGREFGRAGANAILNGKNHVAIKDYSGRIKPSDSELIKAIKQIEKTEFVTTNKANVSRLITITDLVIDNIKFNGRETLNEIDTIFHMLGLYQDKFNHGSNLIDNDFSDKSKDYLNAKTKELSETFDHFFNKAKAYVNSNLEECKKQSPSRARYIITNTILYTLTGVLYSIPLMIVSAILGYNKTETILFIMLLTAVTTGLIGFYNLYSATEEEMIADTVKEYSYFKQFEHLRNAKVSLKLN